MASVKPIPQGYSTVTPSITLSDTSKAIEFYKRALGATERMRFEGPDKKIMHAELQIGTSIIMLSDEVMGQRSPKAFGGSPVSFWLYVEDCDAAYKKAIAAGGKETGSPTDMFWGDRMGNFEDPFGYIWTLATHIKELTPQEIKKAGEEWMKEMAEAK